MMKTLDEISWGEFHIGDVFSVYRPTARSKEDYEYGNIPFVASGSVNNGVMKCCKPKIDEDLDKGECITVSPVDGSTFYQAFDFLGRGGAGSSVLMLRCSHNELMSGQFVARMIAQTCSKYTYGHMGNKDSIRREIAMLPVNADGKPNYKYMSDYVREHRKAMLSKYRTYVAKRISELGNYIEIPPLHIKQWAAVAIPDIFGKIQRGKRLKNADHMPGNIPYVSSTANNNGVDDYVTVTEGTRVFKNCISLANSGSVGTAFYEPFDFVASDHVTHLERKNASKYLYLFLATMLEKQKSNFNFNREINDARIQKLQIMLPITGDGQPDYEYMEQYSKNMMLKKYKQYLAFLDAKEKETPAK